MMITMLQATVLPEQVGNLQAEFQTAIQEWEPGIVETFLAQDVRDPAIWRVITVWQSREALDAMRATGRTPRGVLMFRAAQAEPSLTVLGVAAHGCSSVSG